MGLSVAPGGDTCRTDHVEIRSDLSSGVVFHVGGAREVRAGVDRMPFYMKRWGMGMSTIKMLREAVRAEIEAALAGREEGADGYRVSAASERKEADLAWAEIERRLAE